MTPTPSTPTPSTPSTPVITTYVRVTVRLRGDEAPTTEQLWATAVDVTPTGGTYRLANNGFRCPLVVDDLVDARREPDGTLVVAGVRRRGGRTGWLVHLEVDEWQERLVDEWRATGTIVDWDGWTVATALDPAAGEIGRPTQTELAHLETAGLALGHLRLSGGVELTANEAAWMVLDEGARTDQPADAGSSGSLAS